MGEEKKNPEGEKKAEEPEKKKVPEEAADEKKEKEKDENPPPPPPEETPKPDPPPDIVMRVFMHCEGCARKVRRCLKGFDGVEEVITDCKTHKVVVKGEKADPLKVLDRVQKKTHRQVDLLSPIPPKPSPPEENKTEEKEAPKPEEEKKEEPKVVTVVLKVHMHCEACSLEIKKRIERMKEVEEATPDLKSSEVSVKGTFDPPKLVEYIYKRTGKHAIIVKQDPPPPEKSEDDKGKDGNNEEKKGEGEEDKSKGEESKGGGEGEGKGEKPETEAATAGEEEGAKVVEVRRNEYYYHNYPPRYAMDMHAYPPQIFSDENPNACSIM